MKPILTVSEELDSTLRPQKLHKVLCDIGRGHFIFWLPISLKFKLHYTVKMLTVIFLLIFE